MHINSSPCASAQERNNEPIESGSIFGSHTSGFVGRDLGREIAHSSSGVDTTGAFFKVGDTIGAGWHFDDQTADGLARTSRVGKVGQVIHQRDHASIIAGVNVEVGVDGTECARPFGCGGIGPVCETIQSPRDSFVRGWIGDDSCCCHCCSLDEILRLSNIERSCFGCGGISDNVVIRGGETS